MGPASAPEAAWRDAAIILVVVLALSVPFWGKAFHIDDPFFIAIAENLRAHPLRPFDGAVAMDDTDHRVFQRRQRSANTFETLSHPPLVPYVIAAIALASGGVGEVSQHAGFLGFALLLAWAQYRLARRFTPMPLMGALLLMSCPIVVLAGHSVMTDLPALALFLAALACFVEGADSDRATPLLLSGFVAGLAVLTRYVCFGIVPIAALYAWLRLGRSRRGWLALLPFCIVLALFGLQNWWEHGAIHLAASARHYADYYEGRYLSAVDLGRRTLTDTAALGGTAFPLAVLVGLGRNRRQAGLRLGLAMVGAGAAIWGNPLGLPELEAYGPFEKVALVVFVGAGVLLLAEAASRADRPRPERVFLVSWMGAALIGTIGLLPFGSARYMILVLPPLILLLCGRSTERGAAFVIGVTMALSVVLAVADEQYAGVYRDLARGVPALAGRQRVWFVGDWGFRYYMERGGHRYLVSSDESPAEGDVVIRPQIAGLHEVAPGLRTRLARQTPVPMPGWLPVRMMSFDAKAGYYSHGWGLLPFAFSAAPLERFDIYRVGGPSS